MTAARHPTDDLAIAYGSGSRPAGNALLRACDNLCHAAAIRIARATHADVEDMTQACRIGVLRACEDFDPARGSFATHAWSRMRNEMRDCVIASRLVRIPVHAEEVMVAAKRADADLADALVAAGRVSRETAEHVAATSFDAAVDIDETSADDRRWNEQPSLDASPEEQLASAEQRAWVLAQCSEQERDVLTWRMGGSTLQEIGDAMRLSRERIRQIQDKALRRIAKRLGLAERYTKEKQAA